MARTIERSYSTRRDADLAVEHLVQQLGVERTDIFVAPAGDESSAGLAIGGGDAPTAGEEGRDDAPLSGAVVVSVDVQSDEKASRLEKELDSLM